MSKKRRYYKIMVAVIVIVLVITPVIYVQANKMIYAQRVTKYLLEDQKYTREEIKSVKGVWGKKLPSFFAVVIFEDEPFVEYVYFAHNRVLQSSHRLMPEGKAKGISLSQLKHYEPANDR